MAGADSGSQSGEADSRRAQLGAWESPRRLHTDGGADFRIRLPRRKAQSHAREASRWLGVNSTNSSAGKPMPGRTDASASAGRRNDCAFRDRRCRSRATSSGQTNTIDRWFLSVCYRKAGKADRRGPLPCQGHQRSGLLSRPTHTKVGRDTSLEGAKPAKKDARRRGVRPQQHRRVSPDRRAFVARASRQR